MRCKLYYFRTEDLNCTKTSSKYARCSDELAKDICRCVLAWTLSSPKIVLLRTLDFSNFINGFRDNIKKKAPLSSTFIIIFKFYQFCWEVKTHKSQLYWFHLRRRFDEKCVKDIHGNRDFYLRINVFTLLSISCDWINGVWYFFSNNTLIHKQTISHLETFSWY